MDDGIRVDAVVMEEVGYRPGLPKMLDAKRFDVVANQVSITDERKAKYDFSTPYTVSTGVVVTKSDNDSIHSFEDLNGKTTAQSLTSNWYKLAQQSGANVGPSRAGRRRSHCSSRAVSMPPSTTS